MLSSLPAAAASGQDQGTAHGRKSRYESALQSFRQARFPEAYGRFVELASEGHAAAAHHALWMCESGPALFARQWDCAPHEIAEWSSLCCADPQALVDRIYPHRVAPPTRPLRKR